MNLKLDTYVPSKGDRFIVIDVSNKEFFDEILDETDVVEVIDYHVEYEE